MLLEVGRIARAHGLRGEVVVELVTDRAERVAPGAALSVNGVPLTVDASRPHQGRFIVAFAGVGDRSAAEALVGSVLSAEGIEDDEALWVHELIGSMVRETNGTERGRVVSVQANPAHDQLVLDSGALVPAVFVVSCSDGITLIDPPDGLFD
jgi:16S rRNA processing protein RimM